MTARELDRVLARDPRVSVVPGSKHRKVFVDGKMITVLPKSNRPRRGNDLKASLRELRKVRVIG